jgi:hypothetical protein
MQYKVLSLSLYSTGSLRLAKLPDNQPRFKNTLFHSLRFTLVYHTRLSHFVPDRTVAFVVLGERNPYENWLLVKNSPVLTSQREGKEIYPKHHSTPPEELDTQLCRNKLRSSPFLPSLPNKGQPPRRTGTPRFPTQPHPVLRNRNFPRPLQQNPTTTTPTNQELTTSTRALSPRTLTPRRT